ncbi:MAG TPA: FAD-dependent oxidoreductase [Caldimonas sp.]|nr:FAD-dependent oxidoreductase [Caldimonas sp.]
MIPAVPVRDVDYQALEFAYRPCADQRAPRPAHHPVVVVGAGPIGLALAIDLAQRGVPVVLLDDDSKLSTGSRAICFSKRTLEILDRLGCGQRLVDKGVSWSRGRVFFRGEALYGFDLLPEVGHCRPAFVNLQQYYAEGYLVERAAELPAIDLRWKNKVVAVERRDSHVEVDIETPGGPYRITADWLVACDGARSPVRAMLGLETQGRVFRDRFLIADIRTRAELLPGGASERWFWFDPAFHPNQSVLLHRQPDDVWRVDFQLGWDVDPLEERKPERVIPRVRAFLDASPARGAEFTLEWASVYTFACMRMARFRHGRVLFAGDAAHGVSPFGARGANSGIQDAENLAWKLARVLRGTSAPALLDTYADEREFAADENIRASTRSTDFITPKSDVSRLFRDAVLGLAKEHAFARRLVNSGRLSVPATLRGSALNTPDVDVFTGEMEPGAVAADAPLARGGERTWLLQALGPDFTLLVFAPKPPAWAEGAEASVVCIVPRGTSAAGGAFEDVEGLAAARYDARPGTVYLLRPDQHVCARWRAPDAGTVRAAIARATGDAVRPA